MKIYDTMYIERNIRCFGVYGLHLKVKQKIRHDAIAYMPMTNMEAVLVQVVRLKKCTSATVQT